MDPACVVEHHLMCNRHGYFDLPGDLSEETTSPLIDSRKAENEGGACLSWLNCMS